MTSRLYFTINYVFILDFVRYFKTNTWGQQWAFTLHFNIIPLLHYQFCIHYHSQQCLVWGSSQPRGTIKARVGTVPPPAAHVGVCWLKLTDTQYSTPPLMFLSCQIHPIYVYLLGPPHLTHNIITGSSSLVIVMCCIHKQYRWECCREKRPALIICVLGNQTCYTQIQDAIVLFTRGDRLQKVRI